MQHPTECGCDCRHNDNLQTDENSLRGEETQATEAAVMQQSLQYLKTVNTPSGGKQKFE